MTTKLNTIDNLRSKLSRKEEQIQDTARIELQKKKCLNLHWDFSSVVYHHDLCRQRKACQWTDHLYGDWTMLPSYESNIIFALALNEKETFGYLKNKIAEQGELFDAYCDMMYNINQTNGAWRFESKFEDVLRDVGDNVMYFISVVLRDRVLLDFISRRFGGKLGAGLINEMLMFKIDKKGKYYHLYEQEFLLRLYVILRKGYIEDLREYIYYCGDENYCKGMSFYAQDKVDSKEWKVSINSIATSIFVMICKWVDISIRFREQLESGEEDPLAFDEEYDED